MKAILMANVLSTNIIVMQQATNTPYILLCEFREHWLQNSSICVYSYMAFPWIHFLNFILESQKSQGPGGKLCSAVYQAKTSLVHGENFAYSLGAQKLPS